MHESLLLMVRIQTMILFSNDMKINRKFTAKQFVFSQHCVAYFLSHNLQHNLYIRIYSKYSKNIAKLLFHLFYAIYFQSFLNY